MMKLKYYGKLAKKAYLSDIRQMLALCDKEFVPPLSGRASTTQSDLSPTQSLDADIDKYFQVVASQPAIIAIEGGRVVGLMSFRMDYVCECIDKAFAPNLYITTVLVHPQYRHKGIAGKLYDAIIAKFPKRYLFTRTWSTNLAHIRILLSMGFHEHYSISNDRGPGIDTVYYCRAPQKQSLRQYIAQYHLGSNLFFCGLLTLITIGCVVAWLNIPENALAKELMLAVATSLMASMLCLMSDTFLKIRESRNDAFINTLKGFGIENLQFKKNEILEQLIPHCRNEIWISGYRLIMTGKRSFRDALILACRRSKALRIRVLVVPPWYDAFNLVYGQEDVTVSYLNVFRDLAKCEAEEGAILEIRFSQKPLFSDTYKVDDRFITGPYLNCADQIHGRITARDFFSLDIRDPDKDLYQLISKDYLTLWDEADTRLDTTRFLKRLEETQNLEDATKEERVALFQECCVALCEESPRSFSAPR